MVVRQNSASAVSCDGWGDARMPTITTRRRIITPKKRRARSRSETSTTAITGDGYRSMIFYLERRGYRYGSTTVHKYMDRELYLHSIARPKKPGTKSGKHRRTFSWRRLKNVGKISMMINMQIPGSRTQFGSWGSLHLLRNWPERWWMSLWSRPISARIVPCEAPSKPREKFEEK